MQAKTLKLIAIGLVSLSVMLAIAGYRLSHNALPMPQQSAETSIGGDHRVVIAMRDLASGETLTAADITTVPVPFPVENAFSDSKTLIGRTVGRAVRQAGILNEDTFHNGGALMRETTPGLRAVAIRIDETTGAGGFLQPGDHVDVFYSMRVAGTADNRPLADTLVRNARILAFGSDIAEQPTSAKNAAKDDGNGKRSRSAVLEVQPKDVSRLLLAETHGVLRLAAISTRESDANIQSIGQTATLVSLGDLAAEKPRRRTSQIEVWQGEQVQIAAPSAADREASRHEF